MHPNDRRRLATAIAILLAVPGYVICGLQHVCMAGHMKHPIYPPIHWLNDCFWLSAMAVAAVLSWKSNLRFKRCVFLGLVAMASSRLLLGSGGSLFFLIEIPILAGAVLAALIGMRFPSIDRADWSKQERSAHRRRIVRGWVVSIGACASAVLAILAVIKARDIIRINFAPRIEVGASAIPFKREITVKEGKAIVLVLPDQRTLAVWCVKPSGILSQVAGGVAALEYGEQPFTPLEREEIALPAGGTTTGEYRSYIRQGPVMDRDAGRTSEYILYVNPYRISLDQLDTNAGMRVIVGVSMASEEEKVGPKDEVDHHAKRLRDADENTRMNAIFELEELLLCGSTYATPRKSFIISQLGSLENDPSPDVREVAQDAMRAVGDVDSILKAIQPLPVGRFLNPEEARLLGENTKECDDSALLAPLFRHVLTFFDSDQERVREFAVRFFGATDPAKEANSMLHKALSDPSARVRAAGIHALGNLFAENSREINDSRARDVAIRMLKDPDPEVVIASLETSIYRGENRIFPFDVIQPFLKSDHKGVRLAAIRALHFDQSAEAERVLLDLTRDPAPVVRASAAECLCDSNSEPVRVRMIQLLGDDDSLVRIRALQSLEANPHASAIPAVKALLSGETDVDVIRVANETLESH